MKRIRTRLRRWVAGLTVSAAAVVAIVVGVQAPAAAQTYFNCQNGVACVWIDINGGGAKYTISVGQYGYNTCISFAGSALEYEASSASADFGGGWDLRLYRSSNCRLFFGGGIRDIESSGFENLTPNDNDVMRSAVIMQT